MARRSRSNTNNTNNIATYAIIAIAVIGALVAGKIFLDKRSQHFAKTGELPVADFRDNANSLSGNEYRVTGKISEKLKWTTDKGQIISLNAESSEGSGTMIGIMVPAGVDQVNLEKGQSYTFKVEINREGLPIALDVKAK